MQLLFVLILSATSFASEKAQKSESAKVQYACAWSTRQVTFASASSEEGAKKACNESPPSKQANLEFVKAPDKNGKHGDILIDGVPIDYD